MHIGALTHNYPRFPGDFSGTFIEALCQAMVSRGQRMTVWAPYDPAYRKNAKYGIRNTRDDTSAEGQDGLSLQLYRYIWPDRLHKLGYMRSMQADLALRL